jgi:class 3 adenylate cyclase/YHS domain-containing protein
MPEAKEKYLFLLIADLAGYTAMTEAHGSISAAEIVSKFNKIVSHGIDANADLIERVGDEVFIISRDVESIIKTALSIYEFSEEEPDFPRVKIGLHAGEVLKQDGHYFGSALNLTSRLVNYAEGGEIICSENIKDKSPPFLNISFEDLGHKKFKNIKHPVSIYRLIPAGKEKGAVLVDPVCRMRVNPDEKVEMAEFRGKMYFFCSTECKDQFRRDPEHYADF